MKLSLLFIMYLERYTENIPMCLNYLKNKAVSQFMSFYSITFQKIDKCKTTEVLKIFKVQRYVLATTQAAALH